MDEDAELAALVAGAAARLGAVARVAVSGREALAALADRPGCAVLALPLPDATGDELLAAARAAGVPAIVVSGVHRGPRAGAAARALGAVDFLEKPFPVEALLASVARAVGAEPPALGTADDEVTGAFPLVEADGIAADAPIPALDTAPTPGPASPPGGLAAPLPGAPTPPPVPWEPPPRREGDLARAGVARVLVALHVGQATGALTVARGPVRKVVLLERGAPVYAASNLAAERFGAVCVRRGVVSTDTLEALRREAPGTATGDLLVARGLLDPARRAELLGALVRAIVWSTFPWREGSYAFRLGRPPEGRVPLRLDPGPLLLEGLLRTATPERLRAELPLDLFLAPSPDPAFELWALRLGAAQARLLASADGTKSVADLARLSALPGTEALAFLDACRTLRVLEPVERVLASTRRIGFM